MSKILQLPVAMAINQTVSAEQAIPDGYSLVGIFVPICVGTALTFQAAKDVGGTFLSVLDGAGSAISKTISGTAHYMALDPLLFQGLQNIKLVSGTTETSAITFTLVVRKQPI